MRIPLGRPGAIVKVAGNREAPCLSGTVKFYPVGKATLVVADICGMPESVTDIFAMHIHNGTGCQNSGSHYNPEEVFHPMHAGDLPPLFSSNGRAYLAVLTGRFSLYEVIGKTIVIHAGADDFKTQPAGNPGDKIACGVICRVT